MRRWLCVLAGLFVALQAAARAETNPFHAGQTRFVAGDYRGAYELWLPEAQAGDARAQFSIGVLYQQGLGVQRSILTAAEWYVLAARQGYGPAATALRALAPQLGQPVFEGWKSPREREAALALDGAAAAARPWR